MRKVICSAIFLFKPTMSVPAEIKVSPEFDLQLKNISLEKTFLTGGRM